jgi:hypothetical protein
MNVWENTLGWASMLRLTVFVSPPLPLACPCVTNPDTVMSNAGGEVAGVLQRLCAVQRLYYGGRSLGIGWQSYD